VTGVRLEGLDLVRRYGGLVAVAGVSLSAEPGTVTAVLGANGAGKTTTFAMLTGEEQPDAGRVLLDGRDITALSPNQRARLGVGRTFQRLEVFGGLSVADNLRVGAEGVLGHAALELPAGLFGLRRNAAEVEQRVSEVAAQLGLGPVLDALAATLPTGTLRLVELGRALCGRPRVLLLDEPASGLDTEETDGLSRVVRQVADMGTAVLLVEHDLRLVFGLADWVLVMEAGSLLAAGTPQQVRDDPRVRVSYLDSATAAR